MNAVVPDNYVDELEWMRIREELAWEPFKGLGLTECSEYPFLSVNADEAGVLVVVQFNLPAIEPADEWWDGRHTYYDPDVRPVDNRRALLDQLNKVRNSLLCSLARQPAIDKPPPGLEAERDTHCRHGVPYTQGCEDCGI